MPPLPAGLAPDAQIGDNGGMVFPGQELKWDAEKRQSSNFAEANEWLTFKPRPGYSIDA